MMKLCALLITLIIVLILTGYLKRDSSDNSEKDAGKRKEGYSIPPGMEPARPVQSYYCNPPMVASPSKETLKDVCGPDMICKISPECWSGVIEGPPEFQASTASAISAFIERVA